MQCLRIRPLDVLRQHTLVLEVYRLAAVPVFVDNVQVGGTDTNVFFKAIAVDSADDRMTKAETDTRSRFHFPLFQVSAGAAVESGELDDVRGGVGPVSFREKLQLTYAHDGSPCR